VRAGSIVPLDDGWSGHGDLCRLDTDGDFDADRSNLIPPTTTLGLDHAPGRLAFHCWPTDQGHARGTYVDDAGDGSGPDRRDRLHLVGAVAGATAVVTWVRHGDFPAPAIIRVVLHGFEATSAMADGRPAALKGSSVECGPFTELRLEGLRPVPGRRS
jgi:hypothetical protein